MRIGVGLAAAPGTDPLTGHILAAQQAEQAGFASGWISNIFGMDALTAIAVVGRETSRIELGSFVVPTYPRHPAALAQQALSTQIASGGRLALGIGLSHKVVIEDMFGLDYSRPIPHTREYLTILNGLLAGERVDFDGDLYNVHAQLSVQGAAKPPILFAALGPDMLRLCGRLADGTAVWMGGLAYLRDTAVPTITKAARAAGRPAPRIVAGLPICVTTQPEEAREAANQQFATYGRLPSYRAILDRGGYGGPGEVAIVGDERSVAAQVRELADAGVTDFNASVFRAPGGDARRTYELLAAMAAGETVAG